MWDYKSKEIPLLQLCITCALYKEACQKTNDFQSKNTKNILTLKLENKNNLSFFDIH